MGHIIRGCHPTITPLALPETLPNEISQEMLNRFRAHLSSQLRHLAVETLPINPTFGHHRNASDTGYSATSSNESATGYLSDYQHWLLVNKPDSTGKSMVVPDAI